MGATKWWTFQRYGHAAPEGGGPPSWRGRLAGLRFLPAFLRLVWDTHRGFVAAIVVLRLARAVVPVTTLWVGKLIVDEVVAASRGDPDLGLLWQYLAIEVAIVVCGDLLARTSNVVESLLGDLFSNQISVRIMEHAATLDLEQFEDPSVYDHLERARNHTSERIGLLGQLLTTAQDLVTLLTLGAALLLHSVWLALLLVVAVLPSFLGETHFASLEYSLLFRYTPQRRQLGYLRYVGASDVTAKEVQMFGLAGWLTERYRRLADAFYEENRKLSIRKGIGSSLLALIGIGGYYAAYAAILLATVRGSITIGHLTFLIASFSRSRDLIQHLLLTMSQIYEQTLYLRDLFVFFELRPRVQTSAAAQNVPSVIREGFVFENVGFRYPGSERWAVRHVTFRFRPGERIALVGENGAGKTTLTKLLVRLYDPSEGRITLDGIDLREYDAGTLRKMFGVIFQDFVRFNMRFDENIGVGRIHAVQNYLDGGGGTSCRGNGGSGPWKPDRHGYSPMVPPLIRFAAEKSLASALLERFPDGYRQMLGRHFDGGVNLSGGEWQKVAIARAYMCDARVYILDEPTAALDARAEYEVFKHFSTLTDGRMAVFVSHRFSTVRMADRIIVLTDGCIAEEGTHHALLATGGLYAELFCLQAKAYL